MTKRDRELMVEGVLKRWRKLQEEVWSVEQDAANIAFSQGSGEPVQSSSISDKTARGAFLLESIADKKAWVDCVSAYLKEDVALLYQNGRKDEYIWLQRN